ncbi:hypothetical protein RHGRI_017378 [Rhododendron griersonianum]|uniref:40S ribosomal protein S30 n=1 Tax=Rhododendron griersonianum TaxID=479676 RepID=A0AAV6JXK6_9ERIC|nr:hypothetical protein RHGRI_017378 [Rhododendron griersonianum]
MAPAAPLETILLEGKLHRSLARAGKVRGQTPKVAKQDKKKKPCGGLTSACSKTAASSLPVISVSPLCVCVCGYS